MWIQTMEGLRVNIGRATELKFVYLPSDQADHTTLAFIAIIDGNDITIAREGDIPNDKLPAVEAAYLKSVCKRLTPVLQTLS